MSQLFQRHSHLLAYIVASHWKLGAEIKSALAYVVMSGHQEHRNKTSVLFLASILATYVRLLHDESVVDSAQAVAWLAAANIPSELLAKPFGGI